MLRRLLPALAALLALAVAAVVLTVPAEASKSPLNDPFYTYTGSTPLAQVKPGTILKSRRVPYHIAGLSLPIKAVQLLYRSTNARGKPTVNLTSVLQPIQPHGTPRVVSYQSFYDSLNPADEPSVAIAGGVGIGDGIAYVETLLFAPLLLDGFTIAIPDTEGQVPDFAAGTEYGMNTLDGIRAALHSARLHLPARTKVAMMGYSGGAIGTEWAAELTRPYAPELARNIIGSAAGGIFVDPGHNVHYVNGSAVWSGVLPMALVGLAKAYHVDLKRYASPFGLKVLAKAKNESIITALGAYPGLTWAKLTKPQYSKPENVAPFVRIANELIMGSHGTPTSPLFFGQGTGGYLEGTNGNRKGIGAGDGVMVAGDVRTLAREYCHRGLRVQYQQYAGLSHVPAASEWLPNAYAWLMNRFAGKPAPSSCGHINKGNALTPLKVIR